MFKLLPIRGATTPPYSAAVVDLDALILEPVPFKFQGRIHHVKPIRTSEFFKITSVLARMDKMRDNVDAVTDEALVKLYTECFSSVCDTIGRRQVEQMTQAQCLSLLQLILDTIQGRSQAEIEKKKREAQRVEQLRG